MSQLVEFQIVGRHEITTPVGRVLTPRAPQLFALLLCCGLSPAYRMATPRLRDLLWDTLPLRDRAHALRQLVMRIRQLGVQLVVRDGLVQLDTAQIVPRFVLTRHPTQLRDDAMVPHDIISGELCAAWVPRSRALHVWLEQERRRYAEDLRFQLAPMVEREFRLGNHAHTERLAQRLCLVDPSNPHAQLRYAQAVAIRGDLHTASDGLTHFVREHAPSARVARAQLLRLHEQLRRTTVGAALPGTVFVHAGCEPLLQQLDTRLAAIVGGVTHVVRVLGAPGSGKSTLAVEVGRRAAVLGYRSILLEVLPEPVTVSSHSRAAPPTPAPYAPTERTLLQRLVHRLLGSRGALGVSGTTLDTLRAFAGGTPATPHSTPPSMRRSGRVARVRAMPRSSAADVPPMEDVLALITCVTDEQPVVLCIDDWHAADQAARTFCASLCSRLDAHALLLLVTERVHPHQPRPATRAHPLRRAPRLLSITVPRLTPDQAQRLAMQLTGALGIAPSALPFPLFGGPVPETVGAVVEWLQQATAAVPNYSAPGDSSIGGSSSLPPSYSRSLR